MDRLLRLRKAIIRGIDITAGNDNSGLLFGLKSGMTVKKRGIGKIITTRATAKWLPELQSVWKTAPFAQIRPQH